MAWETDDVVRSIRRYLSVAFESPPWKLRAERREVRDEERPVGVVVPGSLTVKRARTSIAQGNVEDQLPITVNLYPALPETDAGDAMRTARLEAQRAQSRLYDLFARGAVIYTEDEDGNRRHWSGPFRVPLWDYAEVPTKGEERAGPVDPHDVLWVVEESLDVKAIQDPDDPRRWSVIATMRVLIESPGRTWEADEETDFTGVVGAWAGEPPAEPLDWE